VGLGWVRHTVKTSSFEQINENLELLSPDTATSQPETSWDALALDGKRFRNT
jgi:hypothetical protein